MGSWAQLAGLKEQARRKRKEYRDAQSLSGRIQNMVHPTKAYLALSETSAKAL